MNFQHALNILTAMLAHFSYESVMIVIMCVCRGWLVITAMAIHDICACLSSNTMNGS